MTEIQYVTPFCIVKLFLYLKFCSAFETIKTKTMTCNLLYSFMVKYRNARIKYAKTLKSAKK